MGTVKTGLALLFSAILMAMIGVTVRASLHEGVFAALPRLLRDPWGLATLFDAYFAFLTFFVWVAFRERTFVARAGWFVAIMTTGNMAMAVYILLQLWRGSLLNAGQTGGAPTILSVPGDKGRR
ncbi:MAG: DUF1475 family protein [Thermoanaerobaculia bacterium]